MIEKDAERKKLQRKNRISTRHGKKFWRRIWLIADLWEKVRVQPPFEGSGKGNQSFQLWSDIANMPRGRSQDMPDQDGLVTIDTRIPTNPR